MPQQQQVVFRRIRGRVVPIQRKSEDQDTLPAGKIATAGASVAGLYQISKERAFEVKERSTSPSIMSFKKFKKALKPGDILAIGSSAKHSSGVTFADVANSLPKPLREPFRKVYRLFGVKRSHYVYSNATVLPLSGAGARYHAGVYIGKGKVVHMTTDQGAQKEELASVLENQNVTAYRFKRANSKEVNAAIRFAKLSAKKHTPYQSITEYYKNGVSNFIFPLNKKPCPDGSPMVCHTLPIRAYSKRAFPNGEYTMAGDLKRTQSLSAIVRRNTMRRSFGATVARSYGGIALRGAKFGVIAGVAALGINQGIQAYRNYSSPQPKRSKAK